MWISSAVLPLDSRSVYAQVIVEKLWILDYRNDGFSPGSAPPYDPSEDPDLFANIPDPSEVPFLNA